MRLIVNTNQASSIVNTAASGPRTLVIPPLVWAEILLSPPCHRLLRVQAIDRYDVLFGLDNPEIYGRLRRMNEDQIRGFDPVFPAGSVEHLASRFNFLPPRTEMLERARQLRQDSAHCAELLTKTLGRYARGRQASKSKGKTYGSIDEAEFCLVLGENATVRAHFLKDITGDGACAICASSNESFYAAVLDNHALRRFLRLYVTYLLGYGDSWADKELNRIHPSPNRNDIPDMMLALYAVDGNTILSNDKYFRKAFRFADPDEKVRLATWEECVRESEK